MLKEGGQIRIWPIKEAAISNPMRGLVNGLRNITKISQDMVKTENIEFSIIPQDINICGYENEVVLDSILVIKKKNNQQIE